MKDANLIAERIAIELDRRADPANAEPMAAYMKTDMPFYGVKKAGRVKAWRAVVGEIELPTRASYERAVLALWKRPHREEKYLALTLARHFTAHVTLESLPLYERLIREGAWWDLVDEVATQLVGALWSAEPKAMGPTMDAWATDECMWIRRAAIIGQNKRKERVDHRRLFRYCRLHASDTEFFIRKAIGWALREYSYAAPERVIEFLTKNRDKLAGLSAREAEKGMRRLGVIE